MTRQRLAQALELAGYGMATAAVSVMFDWWGLLAAGVLLALFAAHLELNS